jgi:hypothetical protein
MGHTYPKGNIPWNKGKQGLQVAWNKATKGLQTAWNKGLKGYRAGAQSHLWKGGVSKRYKQGYCSTEYKQWRSNVFTRDAYRCVMCGQIGGYLTAHHIKSFAHYPELRYEINNGITLCEECHKLTDNYKGRGGKDKRE